MRQWGGGARISGAKAACINPLAFFIRMVYNRHSPDRKRPAETFRAVPAKGQNPKIGCYPDAMSDNLADLFFSWPGMDKCQNLLAFSLS
jgi:hypothetical protein